ncbi:hypothetical protein ACTFIY_010611 [Dictyostelium cf. discoideum]
MNRLPIRIFNNNTTKYYANNISQKFTQNNQFISTQNLNKISNNHNDIFSTSLFKRNENILSLNREFSTTKPLLSFRKRATSIFSSGTDKLNNQEQLNNNLNVGQPIKVQVVQSKFKVLLFILISGAIIYYFYSNRGKDKGGIMSILTSKPFKSLVERPNITFADVMGAEEAKGELQDLVDFLRNPEKYYKRNIVMPKGILLVGPPGTGKTLLAKSLAGEARVSFITINGSEFEEAFVGVGAKRVRELFEAARKNSPCIVFIDEIDSVGGSRTKRVNYHPSEALNQLLVELDGFDGREGVMVMAATNYQDSLDTALIRSGRFDRIIQVPLPDGKARKSIIDHYLKDKPIASHVNTTTIAQSTPGFSGADLFNLVNWAALETTKHNLPEITMEQLENAKENLMMGKERHSLLMSDEARKICAYHEAGHALVAIMTPGARTVHKATIMPRGDALGLVSMLEKEETFVTKKQLIAQMDVAMGGRAAEELILGKENISQGASSDIQKATSIAKAMVSNYGMSEKVGQIYIQSEKKLSSAQRELVDSEIKSLLDSSYIRATQLLKKYSKEHHLIANALLEYETLSLDEIKDIIASKSLANKKNREQLIKEREELKKKRDEDFKKPKIFKPTILTQPQFNFIPIDNPNNNNNNNNIKINNNNNNNENNQSSKNEQQNVIEVRKQILENDKNQQIEIPVESKKQNNQTNIKVDSTNDK